MPDLTTLFLQNLMPPVKLKYASLKVCLMLELNDIDIN